MLVDCPVCDGWAEDRNGNPCDNCGGTGEVMINQEPTFHVMNLRGQFWIGLPQKWGAFRAKGVRALSFSSVLSARLDARPCGEDFIVVTVETDRTGEIVTAVHEAIG